MRISNTVLKICSRNGLTLYDMGRIIYKPDYENTPSKLELIIEKTDQIYDLISKLNKSSITNEIDLKMNKSHFSENFLKKSNLNSNFEDKQINHKKKDNLKNFEIDEKNIKIDNNEFELNEEEKNTGFKERINESFKNFTYINHKKKSKNEVEIDEKEEESKRLKKKCSLLKRTLSEPKLIKVHKKVIQSESEDDVNDINTSTKIRKKSLEKTNNEDFDSPLNEIYFYYFEQNLVQVLEQEYKIKIK